MSYCIYSLTLIALLPYTLAEPDPMSVHFSSLYLCHDTLIYFCFNDPATTEIYTLSLHDALPIWFKNSWNLWLTFNSLDYRIIQAAGKPWKILQTSEDRKSTRLNSSHRCISYAVFCLKKKSKKAQIKKAKKQMTIKTNSRLADAYNAGKRQSEVKHKQ